MSEQNFLQIIELEEYRILWANKEWGKIEQALKRGYPNNKFSSYDIELANNYMDIKMRRDFITSAFHIITEKTAAKDRRM